MSLRNLLFYSHLTIGVLFGLYFSIVGLTGSAIEFAPEFSLATMPPRSEAMSSQHQPSMESIIERVSAAFPDRIVSRLHFSDAMDGRYKITLRSKSGDIDSLLYVDRATGAFLGMEPRWIRWLRELHYYLLNGRTGETVNGYGALVLMVEALIGLWLWWPAVGRWTRAFAVAWRGGWPTLIHDAHQLVGAVLAALLLVIALTGMYFAFPATAARAFSASLAEGPPPRLVSEARIDAVPPPLVELVDRAAAALPGGIVTSLDPAVAPSDTIRLRVRMPGDIWDVGRSQVDFDRYSGTLLGTRSTLQPSRVDRLVLLMMPVHYGRFGGLPIRVLWALAGFAPAFLFITGCAMWWNRSLVKRLRRA